MLSFVVLPACCVLQCMWHIFNLFYNASVKTGVPCAQKRSALSLPSRIKRNALCSEIDSLSDGSIRLGSGATSATEPASKLLEEVRVNISTV